MNPPRDPNFKYLMDLVKKSIDLVKDIASDQCPRYAGHRDTPEYLRRMRKRHARCASIYDQFSAVNERIHSEGDTQDN